MSGMSTTAPADDVKLLAERSEALSAEELLAALVERFHPRLALACSFQKEESVLLDLVFAVEPRARFFAIDSAALLNSESNESHIDWRSAS